MTVDVSATYLLDVETGRLVDAELWDAITDRQLEDWETLWAAATVEGLHRLVAAGVQRSHWPQSLHWDWKRKAQAFHGVLAKPSFSVMCEGATQGMMFLDLSVRAQIPAQLGQHLVYIDFVESAPWNRPEFLSDIKYRGVGSLLMRAAIELSRHEGFSGRIGLHSLPQSEAWYRDRCGMSDLGVDPHKEKLRYFEMTPQQADAFVAKGFSK
ncbi:GNAT family N-acetyltransferase [Hydrocarboniphaga effusa]|uniref:GNAT family N-acetyltransferase n=1 Tax=Hydrocarboniphaga effusa TaxID=243629 RepID=UPI003BAD6618